MKIMEPDSFCAALNTAAAAIHVDARDETAGHCVLLSCRLK